MKVTTLIPAYKHQYIKELMYSLKFQKYLPCKIIISDDSPNGEYRTEFFSGRYSDLIHGLNIEFYEGPKAGAYENFKHLINIWNNSSELVHLMLDDDVLFPNFYERHLLAHKISNISCSISARWNANHDGILVSGQNAPSEIQNSTHRMLSINSEIAFTSTVAECRNWLGEFSNTVMNANTCNLLNHPKLGTVSYAGLWDLGYFLSASRIAPIGYIQDYLGFFRTGGHSNSSNINGPYLKGAFVAYAALALGSNQENIISSHSASNCYKIISSFLIENYSSQSDMMNFSRILSRMAEGEKNSEIEFISAWDDFLTLNKF